MPLKLNDIPFYYSPEDGNFDSLNINLDNSIYISYSSFVIEFSISIWIDNNLSFYETIYYQNTGHLESRNADKNLIQKLDKTRKI